MRDRKNVIAIKFTDRENVRLRAEADRLEITIAQLVRQNLEHIIGGNLEPVIGIPWTKESYEAFLKQTRQEKAGG